MMGPVVLGGGTPLFEGVPAASLQLLDTRRWDESDNVLLLYRVRQKT
jgi:hypothetical protein